MSALESVGVAVIVFVALEVVAVYSCTALSKLGVKTSEPIVSPDKLASKGL